jgi:TolB protein
VNAVTGVVGRWALVALVAAGVAATASAGGPAGNGRIAFIDAEQAAGGMDVYTVDPDGSRRTRLTFDGRSVGPVFAPDGARIAFLKSHPPALDLYVVNADGTGGARLLATHPEGQGGGIGIFDVVWSPDGSAIAYLLSRAGTEELHVVDSRTGTPLPLPPDGARKASLAWSPDGTLLAYSAGEGPLFENEAIVVRPVAGGRARTLIDLPGRDQSPAWSPDGRWIAWLGDAEPGVRGIFVAASDGSGARLLARSPTWSAGPPRWAPDGTAVAFDGLVSTRPGPRSIPINVHGVFLARVDGRELTLLREHVARPRWSPDGRRILVDAFAPGELGDYVKPGVYGMNADGTCLTYVTRGISYDWQRLPGASPGSQERCVDLVVSARRVGLIGLRGVSYSLVVKNEGTQTATGVELVQRFDADVRLFIGRTSQRFCSASGAVLTCRTDDLEPRQVLALAVLARPARAGSLTSVVSVSANERDADPASNEASVGARIYPCWIAGTDFPETLTGTRAGEEICALAGGDVVRARGGDDVVDGGLQGDVLVGGAGRDRLVGGRGDDRIDARDGERDVVECGWGDDVATVDRFDVVRRGCERISRPRPR